MRDITVFYDGTGYTFVWIKSLLWARKEIKDLGYNIRFQNIMEYFSSSDRSNNILKMSKRHKYDIVLIAHHHSSQGLGRMAYEDVKDVLINFRKNCQLLVWMDTADSTGTTKFEYIPYVDLYFKKQLLADKELYLNPIYGGRLFFQYYNETTGMQDDKIDSLNYKPLPKDQLNKLRLAWNVGVGDLHGFNGIRKYIEFNRMNSMELYAPSNERCYDIHYRGSAYKSMAGYQRYLTVEKLKNMHDIKLPENFTEKIPRDVYVNEVKNSKAIVSPFGWGEICTRDFESFAYGCILIKPDVSHMETFPNWFIEEETYKSIKWDYSDFEEVVEEVINNYDKYISIAINGQELFRKMTSDDGKKLFAEHFISELNL